jgi:probable rRNA maturation factor
MRRAGGITGVAEESRPSLNRRRRIGGDGVPEVFVADEQGAVAVDVERWAALAEAVLTAEGVVGNVELSLLFVDDEEMATLNEQFMGVTGPTDVLAFPIDATDVEVLSVPALSRSGPDRAPIDRGDLPLLLGDVVICPIVAQRQYGDHAGTLDDELALLVVHGLLHVLGHDHAEPVETTRMRDRERELLEAHHWHAPAPPAFRQEQS